VGFSSDIRHNEGKEGKDSKEHGWVDRCLEIVEGKGGFWSCPPKHSRLLYASTKNKQRDVLLAKFFRTPKSLTPEETLRLTFNESELGPQVQVFFD
jgi:hypothetical protein